MDKKLKVEFEKSIDSVAKQYESGIEEGLGNQAMVSQRSKVEAGSEVKTRGTPGLSFGGDNRTFGHIPRSNPSIERGAEFDTDSLMAETANTTQTRKVVENRAPPTIAHSDSTREIKTGPITAKRLESEQETTPEIQAEQPWGASEWIANDCTQSDWRAN